MPEPEAIATNHFGVVDIVVLVVYFAAMASIGPLFSKKNKTTENYFVGGRSYGGFLIGLSMFATSISSITFVAYPADGYRNAYLRFIVSLTLPLGVIICSYIFLPFFRRTHTTSAFEYLEGRFGPGVRGYAAAMFIFSQAIRLSMILYLVALLTQSITGWNPYVCILAGGIVTGFYTITGGIEAVIWTDFIQSFLLWGGGFVCLWYIVANIDGGLGTIVSTAWADGKFAFGDPDPKTGVITTAPWWGLTEKSLIMMFFVGMNNWLTEYSSNQNVIQKYVSTRDEKEARKSILVCCFCSIPTWAFFMFLGTSLYVFFKLNPVPEAADMLTGANGRKPDQILPFFVVNYLPQGFSGLVIAGVLAAAMSSLSSSINAVSAISLVDIYKRHIVKESTEHHYVTMAKVFSVVASVIMVVGAALLMFLNSAAINDTSTKLSAISTAGLFGIYALGFLTLKGDVRAVFCGIGATVGFMSWISAIEMKIITFDGMKALGLGDGLAQFIAKPIDSYYSGAFGNIIMFFVAYFFASLFFRRTRDLKNLTVWTTEEKAQA